MYNKDIIVAPATPPGEAGVAIIRLSGSGCLPLSMRFFRCSTSRFTPLSHTFFHGFFSSAGGDVIDEVLFVYMATPRSYTAEDVVEIHCHGGGQCVEQIVQTFLAAGARFAKPGEFSYRAFLNGRIDLIQAEATAALIRAQSQLSHRLALAQMGGGLSRLLYSACSELREALAFFEAWIDFPDEELPELDLQQIVARLTNLKARLVSLVETYNTGRLYTDGATVILVGRPNVGKSSLLNALLREDRAIVTDIPGTTTDLIEETLLINGLKIRLIDSAGLIETHNTIEIQGVLRAQKKIQTADMILFLIDASSGFTSADRSALAYCEDHQERLVYVLSKSDLPFSSCLPQNLLADAVCLSSLTGSGLDLLRSKIHDFLIGDNLLSDSSVVLTDLRQRDAANRTLLALDRFLNLAAESASLELMSFELRDALLQLGEITGESASADVLDLIFSKFCVGK